jgi:hypothetical protein
VDRRESNCVTGVLVVRYAIALTLCMLGLAAWAQSPPISVFVKLNEPIFPIARGNKYDDPLDRALKMELVGKVTGAGSHRASDGAVEWAALEIELTDVPRGVALIKKTLVELGAPKGSVLMLEQGGRRVEIPVHESVPP